MPGRRLRGLALALLAVGTACRGEPATAPRPPTSGPAPPAAAATSTTPVPPPTPSPGQDAPACPPAPPPRAPDPGRPRYHLRVDVRPAEGVVEGTVQVRFVPDLDTDRLVFRLWPNGGTMARAGARLEPGPVTLDGQGVPSALDEDATVLVVRPGRTLTAGRPVEAGLDWRLTLPASGNERVTRAGDAVRLGSFFPILPWEPGHGWATDPPTHLHAEAATSPTADFDLEVAVPSGFDVLASGMPAGPGRWSAPLVRDVALTVGRFTTATAVARAPEPVQVTVGVEAGLASSPRPYLNKVVAALEDFGRRFGPYPWPTYTLAITTGLSGGIEFPTHVMQGPATLGRSTSHEVGHQWFYGLVGNDQGRDPWLDEGLATWAEVRFEGSMSTTLARAVPPSARGRAGEPLTFWETQPSTYYLGVYVQPAQALGALGDPALVDCALRVYAAANAHRIARPRDLLDALATTFPTARETLAAYGLRG